MKKSFFNQILTLMFVQAFILGSILLCQADAKTYKFNIDTFWGPGYFATKNAVLPCLKAIETESNGQITFKPYYAQSLAKDREGYDATAMGMVDIYFFTGPNYETGTMIRGAIFSLPFALPLGKENVKAASRIMETVYKDKVIQEIDPNVVVIGWGGLSEYRFMTVNKVEKLSDLRGVTIRSSGGYHDDIIIAAEASPEAMSPGDIYEALEKKILGGVFHTYAAQYGWGTYKPLKFATNLGFATFPYYTVMNKKKFDSLPDNLKAILVENFRKSGAETSLSYYASEAQHVPEMGIEQVVISKEATKEFRKATIIPVWKKWIRECEGRNIDWRSTIKSLEAAWIANNLIPPEEWVDLSK